MVEEAVLGHRAPVFRDRLPSLTAVLEGSAAFGEREYIVYEDRRLARAEEDRDRDGAIDTWTSYRVSGDREVVDRIEKDTTGDGKRDTFEVYEQVGGKLSLKTRDEDKNADGVIDVKSVYENGKLKQREISDPAMVPL